MEEWRKDARSEVLIVDLEALVPQDHLLRKIERVMDYEWIYERLDPYYCHNNGRPGTDPVVLIKMVLIQHMNLKKLAIWSWNNSVFSALFALLTSMQNEPPVFA